MVATSCAHVCEVNFADSAQRRFPLRGPLRGTVSPKSLLEAWGPFLVPLPLPSIFDLDKGLGCTSSLSMHGLSPHDGVSWSAFCLFLDVDFKPLLPCLPGQSPSQSQR